MPELPSTTPDDTAPHESGSDASAPEQTEGRQQPRRPVRLTDDEAAGVPEVSASALPAGRYAPAGQAAPRPWLRWLAVGAIAVAVAVIAWITMGPDSVTVRGKEVGFTVNGPESVELRFDVAKPTDATVVCTLDALNTNFAQVGTRDVTIGPSDTVEARYAVTIATTELAVTAVVGDCTLVD